MSDASESKSADALRSLLTFALLVFAILGALRLLPGHWSLNPTQRRVADLVEVLPEIVNAPEKQIHIFGASAAFTIVPTLVDSALNDPDSAQYVTYSFADLTRSFRAFLMFARHLEDVVESSGEKTFLSLVSLPMAHLTKARRTAFVADGMRAIENSESFNACLFLDFDGVRRTFPLRQMLGIYWRKLLLNCGSPTYLKAQVGSAFRRFGSRADGTDMYLMMISGEPQWDGRTRGAQSHIAEGPLSAWVEATFLQYQTPVHFAAKRDFRVSCCDIEDLDLEEQGVSDYLESVELLQRISEHTLFFEMPYNREYIQRSVEGQANRDALVAAVIEKAGIGFVDFSGEMETEDFSDMTHLMPSSARRFSREFGEAIRQRIQDFPD